MAGEAAVPVPVVIKVVLVRVGITPVVIVPVVLFRVGITPVVIVPVVLFRVVIVPLVIVAAVEVVVPNVAVDEVRVGITPVVIVPVVLLRVVIVPLVIVAVGNVPAKLATVIRFKLLLSEASPTSRVSLTSIVVSAVRSWIRPEVGVAALTSAASLTAVTSLATPSVKVVPAENEAIV